MKNNRETFLYLKSLKESGVKEVLVERKSAAKAKPAALPVKPALSDAAALKSEPVTAETQAALKALREEALKCMRCQELSSTRQNVVFGAGSENCKLMFVGEAPGRDEDKQGLPFVGDAGKLLTQIIEAMGLKRDQVYIANTLKCRPPKNRPPEPDEVANCRPFLEKQIELINPAMICALGKHASQALLKTDIPISKLRGEFRDYPGPTSGGVRIPVMCTYHPAYLLRNPAEKRTVWEDMKKIMKALA